MYSVLLIYRIKTNEDRIIDNLIGVFHGMPLLLGFHTNTYYVAYVMFAMTVPELFANASLFQRELPDTWRKIHPGHR
ncbi:hypothetical protein [Paenibacillus sp. PDC88]|uniref:hypothetical protein n=1 Tax=Paenibacillus sp. PDC88 TaxID=1884375 RepID=UPI0015A60E1D|nr:hypothetical protein [Paenibacillus sp. PDC88]